MDLKYRQRKEELDSLKAMSHEEFVEWVYQRIHMLDADSLFFEEDVEPQLTQLKRHLKKLELDLRERLVDLSMRLTSLAQMVDKQKRD